jgi:hypothetical protein
MFQIGDRVKSLKIGPPAEGIITGIYPGKSYRKAWYREKLSSWYANFPKWEEKAVYFVKYSQPRKSVTFEKFKVEYGDILNNEELQQGYNELPSLLVWGEAEDNLQLI